MNRVNTGSCICWVCLGRSYFQHWLLFVLRPPSPQRPKQPQISRFFLHKVANGPCWVCGSDLADSPSVLIAHVTADTHRQGGAFAPQMRSHDLPPRHRRRPAKQHRCASIVLIQRVVQAGGGARCIFTRSQSAAGKSRFRDFDGISVIC